MANVMHTDCLHRASGEMAYHVLDTIEALFQSSQEDRHILLSSSCHQPEPFAPGLQTWQYGELVEESVVHKRRF